MPLYNTEDEVRRTFRQRWDWVGSWCKYGKILCNKKYR